MLFFGTKVCIQCYRKVTEPIYINHDYHCPKHGDLYSYQVVRVPDSKVNWGGVEEEYEIKSVLPKEPNKEAINKMLLKIRKGNW